MQNGSGLKHSKKLNAYVRQKGLVSNSMILNGRALRLQAIDDLQEIRTASQTRSVPFLYLFKKYLMQEQQLIMTGYKHGHEDPADFILSQGTVQKCYFDEATFSSDANRFKEGSDRESLPPLCEIISLEGWQDSGFLESMPLEFQQWSRVKESFNSGSFGE